MVDASLPLASITQRESAPFPVAQITKQQSKSEASVVTAFPKMRSKSSRSMSNTGLSRVRQLVVPAAAPTGPRSEAVVVPSLPLCEITSQNKAKANWSMRLRTSAGASLNPAPALDMLYRLKLTWQNFGVRLSVSARELTQHATSLEEQLARLDQLNKTWQATLQAPKLPETPPPMLQRVVDSIESAFARSHRKEGQARVSHAGRPRSGQRVAPCPSGAG